MATTQRLCCCDTRREMRDKGDFVFSSLRGGWLFVKAKRRVMSAAARYRAFSERSEWAHEDHTGESFIWECCPYCGNDLPQTEPYYGQADGEDGG